MHTLPYHTVKIEQQEHWRRSELQRLALTADRTSAQRRRSPRAISVDLLVAGFRRIIPLVKVAPRPQG